MAGGVQSAAGTLNRLTLNRRDLETADSRSKPSTAHPSINTPTAYSPSLLQNLTYSSLPENHHPKIRKSFKITTTKTAAETLKPPPVREMGKKRMARKQPSTTDEKIAEDPTTMEAQPPSPQQSNPEPAPQIPAMVQLDALAAYLRQQDPNRDWTATLAEFSQGGGAPPISTPTPVIPTTTVPTPAQEEISQYAAPTPVQPQGEPLNVSPLSAYQDPGPVEDERAEGDEKKAEGEGEEEKNEAKETPVTKTLSQEEKGEEIDLNETAKKLGLMTDDEFQSILDGVNEQEGNTDETGKGLDLASQAVKKGETSGAASVTERVAHQSVEEVAERQFEQEVHQPVDTVEEERNSEASQSEAKGNEEKAREEAEIQLEEHEAVVPTISKPKAIKRKLVLKSNPEAEGQKQRRVSQRCLGKWTSSKAKSNTAEDAVEVSSESERTTPTKPGEEPSKTSQEGSPIATRTVPPTPTGQEADKVAEGLGLVPKPVSQKEAIDDGTQTSLVAEPTAQVSPSMPTAENPEEDEDEAKYQQEKKRKGKIQMKGRKQVVKKQRTANTGVVIREPVQSREASDSDYNSSEESESESDVSLEGEEYHEQQIPGDHLELVHPPAERVVYRRWHVELTDEVMEDMKYYNTKKLQDAFDDKEDNSKQVKSGKVLHLPSLAELSVQDSFLASIETLGFEWLLGNRDPEISVRLAKEFFTTFRFQVTTDLDEVSISFRVFGAELSMSLIEWTVRLGICSLEEAIGPEWRNRERGIPRRHVEFDPQEAWEELTHPAAGQFASTISRSTNFSNPMLRLVQLYLGYNLLGQTNSAARTSMTELYLVWCAKRGRKLHLGFWTAYQCHLIATHPARNLSLCHIPGAFVRNNIIVNEAEDLSPMYMVDTPGLFDVPFFVRTHVAYYREGVPQFYRMGEVPGGRAQQRQGEPAGQNDQAQGQRQANLERAVAELAEENRQSRTEMAKLTALMENVLKELARGRGNTEAGPSNHGGQDDEPTEPEKEEGDELEEAEESDEDQSEQDEEEPPAQNPAPRRSRRNV